MLHHPYGTRTLTKREHQVIALVADGLKNRDVAQALGTTEAVIKNYLRRIYDKLGVWSRVELALWYEARRQPEVTPAKPQDRSRSVATAAAATGGVVASLPSSSTTGVIRLTADAISKLHKSDEALSTESVRPKLRTGTSV